MTPSATEARPQRLSSITSQHKQQSPLAENPRTPPVAAPRRERRSTSADSDGDAVVARRSSFFVTSRPAEIRGAAAGEKQDSARLRGTTGATTRRPRENKHSGRPGTGRPPHHVFAAVKLIWERAVVMVCAVVPASLRWPTCVNVGFPINAWRGRLPDPIQICICFVKFLCVDFFVRIRDANRSALRLGRTGAGSSEN